MTQAKTTSERSFWLRKPVIGLVAVTAGLLGQWGRHAVYPITETLFGDYYYWALLAIGLVGFIVIALNLNKPEIRASVAGYVGGLLIWIGWFEFTFHFFAERFGIQPYRASERLVSSPDLNMVQASFPLLVTMLLLYGFLNKETKCNFMRWFHRNTHMSPGMPTGNRQRSYARITAMETLLVI